MITACFSMARRLSHTTSLSLSTWTRRIGWHTSTKRCIISHRQSWWRRGITQMKEEARYSDHVLPRAIVDTRQDNLVSLRFLASRRTKVKNAFWRARVTIELTCSNRRWQSLQKDRCKSKIYLQGLHSIFQTSVMTPSSCITVAALEDTRRVRNLLNSRKFKTYQSKEALRRPSQTCRVIHQVKRI